MAIKVDTSVLNGNPHIEGSSQTVFDIILECDELGMADVRREYNLHDKDIIDALKFCSARECEREGSFCGGCELRNKQDNIHNVNDFINRFATVKFSLSDKVLYGKGEGTLIIDGGHEEIESYWKGLKGWSKAKELLSLYETNS